MAIGHWWKRCAKGINRETILSEELIYWYNIMFAGRFYFQQAVVNIIRTSSKERGSSNAHPNRRLYV